MGSEWCRHHNYQCRRVGTSAFQWAHHSYSRPLTRWFVLSEGLHDRHLSYSLVLEQALRHTSPGHTYKLWAVCRKKCKSRTAMGMVIIKCSSLVGINGIIFKGSFFDSDNNSNSVWMLSYCYRVTTWPPVSESLPSSIFSPRTNPCKLHKRISMISNSEPLYCNHYHCIYFVCESCFVSFYLVNYRNIHFLFGEYNFILH